MLRFLATLKKERANAVDEETTFRCAKYCPRHLCYPVSARPPQEGGGEPEHPVISKERSRLLNAADLGADFYPLTLSIFRLFSGASSSESINESRAVDYHGLVDLAVSRGVVPVGVSPVWVFPASADAPRIPEVQPPGQLGSSAPVYCIPEFSSPDYQRLYRFRNSMFATLAREFPEIKEWIVGYEPNFTFYDCAGEQLAFSEMIVFFVDTLQGINQAVKSVRPDSVVIADFLGRRLQPILIRGDLVQPRALIQGILEEIQNRGGALADYLDESIVDRIPGLLEDRFEARMPQNGRTESVDRKLKSDTVASNYSLFDVSPAGCSGCGDTQGCDGTVPACCETTGWNVKCLENFNTARDDLAVEDDNWEDLNSSAEAKPITVESGLAELRMGHQTLIFPMEGPQVYRPRWT